MHHPPPVKLRGNLLESVKKFLEDQSVAPPVTGCCSSCGSVLHYLPTQFWLEGIEQGWNIRLPYCAHCRPLPIAKETLVA